MRSRNVTVVVVNATDASPAVVNATHAADASMLVFQATDLLQSVAVQIKQVSDCFDLSAVASSRAINSVKKLYKRISSDSIDSSNSNSEDSSNNDNSSDSNSYDSGHVIVGELTHSTGHSILALYRELSFFVLSSNLYRYRHVPFVLYIIIVWY